MSLMRNARPRPDEYDKAFERYVSRVPETDVLPALEKQPGELRAVFASLPPERETYRYAPGKWTIREVVGHMLDAERVFGYRALAVSRGDRASLPGYDEDDYAKTARHGERRVASLLDELACVRSGHVFLLGNLDDEAWSRLGTANALPITPRAIAYILVGHVRHHMAVLAERYGVPAA